MSTTPIDPPRDEAPAGPRVLAPDGASGGPRALPAWLELLLPGLLLALGLVLLFYPVLRSHLREIPGDLGDARLVNYLLEHTFLWVTGRSDHAALWDLPIFYPRPNISAYSETLLGAAPFYWLFRALSIAPDTAFQLWMLTMAALDFLAAFLLLRRGLRCGTLAAGAGAFLFAFGGARAVHLPHAQLLPHFYSVIAVYALIEVFRAVRAGSPAPGTPGWVMVAALSVVAQLYASFYLGWFLLLGLALLALVALAFPVPRRELWAALQGNWRGLLLAAALSLLALSPLLVHSERAAAELPIRRWAHTLPMIPSVTSWATRGSRSWLYTGGHKPGSGPPAEVPIGMGLATSACAVAGLWQAARGRRAPGSPGSQTWPTVLLAATALLVLLTLRLPGDVTAWRLLWLDLPSAAAIRAVFRVGVFALLPAALGFAWFLDGRRRFWVAALLVAFSIVEQGTNSATYDKYAARERAEWIAARVGPGCRAFFFIANREGQDALAALYYHVDAVAAQALTRVPTINGYSGQFPPGWNLYEIVLRRPEHRRLVHGPLADWMAREHLDPAGVCVIEEPYPFR